MDPKCEAPKSPEISKKIAHGTRCIIENMNSFFISGARVGITPIVLDKKEYSQIEVTRELESRRLNLF